MITSAPAVQRHRLDYLDSIRAIAAIAVAYFHAAMALALICGPREKAVFDFFTKRVDSGKVGVIAFFMVSGFIIPVSLKAGKPRIIALRDFLIGRVFRLYPAYWLTIPLSIYLVDHLTFGTFNKRELLFNITMFQGFFGVKDIMGLYWTLQIEWIFYILCMMLFVSYSLTKPKRILGVFFMSLAASFALAFLRYKTHKGVPVAATLGMCVMFGSTLWRMVILEKRSELKRYVILAFGSFAVSIPVISLLAYGTSDRDWGWIHYTTCYLVAAAFFLLATSYFKMTWAPLAAVGRASYSLYLMNNFFRLIVRRPSIEALVMPISSHLLVVIELAVSIAGSLLVYEFFEKPLIALGKRLVRSLSGPKPAKQETAVTEFV